MKLTLILSSVCVMTLALICRVHFGAKAQSQTSTIHPAINGRFAHSDTSVSSLPQNRFVVPSTEASAAGDPEAPRVYLNTYYVAPTGRTIAVNEGGDLQSALNQAQ